MNVAYRLQLPAPLVDQKQSYTGIWLALAVALLLHVIFVLMPLIQQKEQHSASDQLVEKTEPHCV